MPEALGWEENTQAQAHGGQLGHGFPLPWKSEQGQSILEAALSTRFKKEFYHLRSTGVDLRDASVTVNVTKQQLLGIGDTQHGLLLTAQVRERGTDMEAMIIPAGERVEFWTRS